MPLVLRSLAGDAAQHPGDEVERLLNVDGVFPPRFGIMQGQTDIADDLLASSASFMPSLCFSLADEKKREFAVERMCFMEDQDEWYFLECGKLEKLVKKYAPHIEKESMFGFL